MTGWIKIHRKIIDHWIWADSKRFKWWLDILLLTNHSDKKMMIGGNLVLLKRGSFHTSELKLSERWNVSRNTVRNYLNALEKDNMINTKKTKNGRTIKVHNYEVYQGKEENKKHMIEQQSEQLIEQQTIQPTEQQSEQIIEQQTEQKRDNRLNRTLNKSLNKTKNIKNIKNDKNVKNEKKEKKYKAFDFFQENGFGFITQYLVEEISYYLDNFSHDSDEIVIAALKIAKDRNKVNWGYAKSILNSWLQSNLNSIDQIRAYEIQQKALRDQYNKPKQFQQCREKTPDWIKNRDKYQDEIDENFEEDRAKFLKELNEQWGD
ncbi:DnaD domain protein [Staphylococcus epidermidis]|uniref:DnaD domain protein n=1 Tax=Staphylococcus epidermidis TaxID=1282 RepID=UPI0036D42F08